MNTQRATNKNVPTANFLETDFNAGAPFGGFQVDLILDSDVSLTFCCLSFLKNHLHLIFLLKSDMSLRKSTSLIEGVGENPNPFSNTFISNVDKVFRLKLKT